MTTRRKKIYEGKGKILRCEGDNISEKSAEYVG